MNFIRPDLFDFAKNSTLKSKFKGTKKIAKTLNISFDEVAIQSLNPQLLFDQLTKGKINLELIQVFALMGWENHQWTSKNGKTAMRNWWLSALDKDQQGESVFRQVMVLRTILADTERYPAPKDVIQTMRTGLENLIQSGEWKYKNHLDVLRALITQNVKILAEIAFQQNISVLQLIQEAGFPIKLPIVKDAGKIWIQLWFKSEKNKRFHLKNAIGQTLNYTSSLEHHTEITNLILDDVGLARQVESLKNQVSNYPEITEWLKRIKSTHQKSHKLIDYYKKLRNPHAKLLLSCWIGVGNYEQLKAMVYNLADMHFSDHDEWTTNSRNAQKRRYDFWQHYQFLFEDIWLLLPNHFWYISNTYAIDNTRHLYDFNYPLAIFKLGHCYICEPFVAKATQAQLFIIYGSEKEQEIEDLLSSEQINFHQLKSYPILLEHNHHNGWQPLLKTALKDKLGIS